MSELVTPGQEGLRPPLESLRHSVQGLVSGQLRGQMRLLLSRLSSLSRLGKFSVGAGAGFWIPLLVAVCQPESENIATSGIFAASEEEERPQKLDLDLAADLGLGLSVRDLEAELQLGRAAEGERQ